MRKKKKTNFKKAVSKNVEKQKRDDAGFRYISLPKGIEMFSVDKEGKYTVDFLPYEVKIDNHPDREEEIAMPGEWWYKLPFKVHKGIGVGNDSVVCPTTFGKKCPICDYRKKRQGEGASKEELDAFKSSKRNLYALLHKGEIKIWDVSDYLFQKLLNEELAEDEDYASFPDPEDGYSIKIRFEEKTFNKNNYYQTNRIDFEERDEPIDSDILEEVPCLDELLIVKPYAELEAMLFEVDPEDVADEDDAVEEEEETETPKPTRRKKSVKEEVIEEEEEEEPKKTSKKEDKSKKESKTPKCPHGYTFGEDADNYDECVDCELWDDCVE